MGVSGTPTVGTWFMPSDVASLDTADADIGSSGPLLIPGSSLHDWRRQERHLYVLNRTDDGGLRGRLAARAADRPAVLAVLEQWPDRGLAGLVGEPGRLAPLRLARKAPLAAFAFNRSTNLFNTTALAHGVDNPTTDPQGGQMSLSANGSTAGTGILWATHPLASTGGGGAVAGVLYAYNAENVAQKLWDSTMSGGRRAWPARPSTSRRRWPTARSTSGRFSDKVEVYGLFADQGPPDAGAGDPAGRRGAGGRRRDAAGVDAAPC